MSGDPTAIAFPGPMLDEGLDFSFSGLKTAVVRYVRKHPEVNTADVAASFQQAVVDVLLTKARRAAAEVGAKRLVPGRRSGGELVAARAVPRRVRGRRAARLPAEPADVHRQRGDDRERGVVAARGRRPEPLDTGADPSLALALID